MAAITISPRVVLQDDSGTYENPAGDGTPINNALFQTLQDRIDALFNGTRPFTLGGLLRVEGFGDHVFEATGPGGNILYVRNHGAGTADFAALFVGNDAIPFVCTVQATSTTHVGTFLPDAAIVQSLGSNGLQLAAFQPTGSIRLHTLGGTTPARLTIGPSGHVAFNAPVDPLVQHLISGVLAPAAAAPTPLFGCALFPTINPPAGQASLIGLSVGLTSTIPGPGLVDVWGVDIQPPVLTPNLVNSAITLHVGGPPPASLNSFSVFVEAGRTFLGGDVEIVGKLNIHSLAIGGRFQLNDGTPAAPGLGFVSEPDTGLYRTTTPGLAVTLRGITTLICETDRVRIMNGVNLVPHIALSSTLGTAAFPFGALHVAAPDTANPANCFISAQSPFQLMRATSARKYKTAIAPLTASLDRILALEPITYASWRAPEGERFPGLIAEEVAAIFPDLVEWKEGEPDYVRYDRVSCYLLIALRALGARLAALEMRP